MIREQRYQEILDYLRDGEIHKVEDISASLKIPFTTLRRDLNELSKNGKINKMHGGASLPQKSLVIEELFEKRLILNIDDKKICAKKATNIIEKHDCIFLDTGSTVFYLAQILDPKLNLTIVTNSIHNVLELSKRGHKNIFLIGGQFADSTMSILGYEAVESIKRYSFHKSFLGVNAIDKELNLYTTSAEHAQIKAEVIKNSEKNYAIADHSKMNSKSFIKYATKKEVEIIE